MGKKAKSHKEGYDVDTTKILRINFYEDDEIIAEQIMFKKHGFYNVLRNGEIKQEYYHPGDVAFCIYDKKTEKVTIQREIRTGEIDDKGREIIYLPQNGDELEEEAVLLPSGAEDFESIEELTREIKEHIHKYLDIPEEFETFATWYILLTYVYDKVNTLPYLRALGDTGTGKSRFLDVIGRLCYKATICSGSITPAPIYRMIKKWKGTIILDEADMRKSDEKNEVITILNCGFERGRPVLRATKDNPDKIQALPTFSPKVFATRKRFQDVALESRCLTCIMQETNRDDIPSQLPPEFYEEEDKLRNKLLMFRFKYRDKIDPDKIQEIDKDLKNIEPRLRQATSSFAVLFANIDGVYKQFKDFLEKYQAELIEERADTTEGLIVNAIYSLTHVTNVTDVTKVTLAKEGQIITTSDIEKYIKENFDKEIDTRVIGRYLRTLGIETKQKKIEGENKRILILEPERLLVLFKRYIPGFISKSSFSNICNIGNMSQGEKQQNDFIPTKEEAEKIIEDANKSYHEKKIAFLSKIFKGDEVEVQRKAKNIVEAFEPYKPHVHDRKTKKQIRDEKYQDLERDWLRYISLRELENLKKFLEVDENQAQWVYLSQEKWSKLAEFVGGEQ